MSEKYNQANDKSDSGYVTIRLSREFVERAVPFLVGLLIGCGGKAGIDTWLLPQPAVPALPTTEEMSPQP